MPEIPAGGKATFAAEGGLGHAALGRGPVVGEREGELDEDAGAEAAERATSDQPRRLGVPAPEDDAVEAVAPSPFGEGEAVPEGTKGDEAVVVDIRRLAKEGPAAAGGEAGELAVGHNSGLMSGTGSLLNAAPVEP